MSIQKFFVSLQNKSIKIITKMKTQNLTAKSSIKELSKNCLFYQKQGLFYPIYAKKHKKVNPKLYIDVIFVFETYSVTKQILFKTYQKLLQK